MMLAARMGSLAALALLAALAWTSPAWGEPEVANAQTWVLAQAEDPSVDGTVEAGEEGVDADLRFEFGQGEETPGPVAAGGEDAGVSMLWVVGGIGVVVVVLLIALLSRGGGTTVIRE